MCDSDPDNLEVSPVCSPLTSDGPPNAEAEAEASQDRLLEVLTRPREGGGYGGVVSFTEFAMLARSLRWEQDDIEDCWYDVVRGIPAREAADMPRVAEMICGYCLASAYPLPGRRSMRRPSTSPPRSAQPAPAAVDVAVADRAVQTGGPPLRSTEGIVASPPRSPASSSSVGVPAREPPRPQPAITATASPRRRQRQRQAAADDSYASLLSSFRRFAVATESSRRKTRGASPPRDRSRRRPAAATPTPPRRRSTTDGAVFERLYAQSKGGTPQRRPPDDASSPRSARARVPTAIAHEEAVLRECTFRPAVTSPRSGDDVDWERVERRRGYKRPTKAHLARLLGGDGRRDPLSEVPPSPRAVARPAPGPSAFVPPGYVESVARLRRGAVRRASQPALVDFSQSLRDDPVTPAQLAAAEERRMLDAALTPILRLPMGPEGGAECVDVRLATPLRGRDGGRATPRRYRAVTSSLNSSICSSVGGGASDARPSSVAGRRTDAASFKFHASACSSGYYGGY